MLLAATGAIAEEPQGFVSYYPRGVSLSVMAAAEGYGAPASYPARLDTVASAAIGVRLAASGFLLGLGAAVLPGTLEPRLSLGFAFALSQRVALSPAVRASVWLSTTGGQIHCLTAGVELPITIYLAKRLFLEPFGLAGVRLGWGFGPMFSIGVRLGWTFGPAPSEPVVELPPPPKRPWPQGAAPTVRPEEAQTDPKDPRVCAFNQGTGDDRNWWCCCVPTSKLEQLRQCFFSNTSEADLTGCCAAVPGGYLNHSEQRTCPR